MSGVFLPLGLSITDLNVSLFTALNLEGKMFNIIALQARMGQPHHPKASTRTEAGFRGPKPVSPVTVFCQARCFYCCLSGAGIRLKESNYLH